MNETQNELDLRYGRRNPRTDAQPMAFTFAEFARGATGAWGWFLLLSVPALLIYGGFSMGAFSGIGLLPVVIMIGWPIYVLPASLVALGVGSPLAWLLGWSLRRVGSVAAHVVAFSAYGVVVGIAMTWATFTVLSSGSPSTVSLMMPAAPFVVASAVAVALGRHRAILRTRSTPTAALAADAGETIDEE